MNGNIIPTTIISTFPGIGAATASSIHPMLFRKLEFDDYFYKKPIEKIDPEGENEVNPLWPDNYLRDIKALDHSGMYRGVFVSEEKTIRKLMKEQVIKYTIVCPKKDDEKIKKILMGRYEKKFKDHPLKLGLLTKNYDNILESMLIDTNCTTRIEIDSLNLNGWYGWAY